VIYGEFYVSGPEKEEQSARFVNDVMEAIRSSYHQDAVSAMSKKGGIPPAGPTLEKVRGIIASKIRESETLQRSAR